MTKQDLLQIEALIQRLLSTTVTRLDLQWMEARFTKKSATKDDLKQFATKDDLKRFATKDDLKRFATKDDLKRFATKDDLKRFATKVDLKKLATKEDLKRFATKEDLKEMKDSLSEEIGSLFSDFNQTIDEQKADRSDVAKIDRRVTKIERTLPQ